MGGLVKTCLCRVGIIHILYLSSCINYYSALPCHLCFHLETCASFIRDFTWIFFIIFVRSFLHSIVPERGKSIPYYLFTTSADWALGSLVVVIIPFLIDRRLALLMRAVIATCLQWFRFRPAFCASAVCNGLPDNLILHSHRNCSPNAPGREHFSKLSDAHDLEEFLQYFSALRTHQTR